MLFYSMAVLVCFCPYIVFPVTTPHELSTSSLLRVPGDPPQPHLSCRSRRHHYLLHAARWVVNCSAFLGTRVALPCTHTHMRARRMHTLTHMHTRLHALTRRPAPHTHASSLTDTVLRTRTPVSQALNSGPHPLPHVHAAPCT